jgi:hypothetical protein
VSSEIRLVLLPRTELATPASTILGSGRLAIDFVTLNFWVSAKKPGAGAAQHLAETIGELVKALCANPDARWALAQKGIGAMTTQGGVQWIASNDYAKRLVVVNCQLQYFIQFTDDALATTEDPNTIAGAKRSVNFLREPPLEAGGYLVGFYRFSVPANLTGVHVAYWPSQGQDVTIELEVGGVLTGRQVVLPQGAANVDSNVDVSFSALTVAPNQGIRWLVVSAPIPELSAWKVTLAMDVAASG